MFVDFPEFMLHDFVLLLPYLIQVVLTVTFFIVVDQVAIVCEILEADSALENLHGKTFWLFEHSLVCLQRLLL